MTRTRSGRSFFPLLAVCLLFAGTVAASTPLVTGNGFGFAVVSPETGRLTKFYAHPYSFAQPDPKDPLSEGIETANFIKSIGWSGTIQQGLSVSYADDSHVIRTSSTLGEGTFFLPFGFDHDALIINWKPSSGAKRGHFEVEWNHALQSRNLVRVSGTEVHVLDFEGVTESLLLIPLGVARSAAPGQELSTSSAWALISVERDEDVAAVAHDFIRWCGRRTASALEKRELDEVERWRVKVPAYLDEKERHLWRQSEIVLRMAQNREPNRDGRYGNGLIVACLPDGSWFMTWARDMAYAAVALARMGHQKEARAAILAYFNARPTGKMKEQTGVDYQVSVVRYFGNGEEEPFFTNEGSTNIEFDN